MRETNLTKLLEILAENENTRCKDSETKQWYHSGESWDVKNCRKCVCFEGEISCTASVCSKPLCPNPLKMDGECCPVCPNQRNEGYLICNNVIDRNYTHTVKWHFSIIYFLICLCL